MTDQLSCWRACRAWRTCGWSMTVLVLAFCCWNDLLWSRRMSSRVPPSCALRGGHGRRLKCEPAQTRVHNYFYSPFQNWIKIMQSASKKKGRSRPTHFELSTSGQSHMVIMQNGTDIEWHRIFLSVTAQLIKRVKLSVLRTPSDGGPIWTDTKRLTTGRR